MHKLEINLKLKNDEDDVMVLLCKTEEFVEIPRQGDTIMLPPSPQWFTVTDVAHHKRDGVFKPFVIFLEYACITVTKYQLQGEKEHFKKDGWVGYD
ncbi:hypothetical protein ACFLY5_00820 [Patescibacteria group bacterium]